jgi:hypothetical protein
MVWSTTRTGHEVLVSSLLWIRVRLRVNPCGMSLFKNQLSVVARFAGSRLRKVWAKLSEPMQPALKEWHARLPPTRISRSPTPIMSMCPNPVLEISAFVCCRVCLSLTWPRLWDTEAASKFDLLMSQGYRFECVRVGKCVKFDEVLGAGNSGKLEGLETSAFLCINLSLSLSLRLQR